MYGQSHVHSAVFKDLIEMETYFLKNEAYKVIGYIYIESQGLG
jgi:hypothetical protein